MALEGVLANIPGLAGYLATQQNDQRQALGNLQGLMSMLQAQGQIQQQQALARKEAEAQRAQTMLGDIVRQYGPRTETVTSKTADDEMTGTPGQTVTQQVQRPADFAGMGTAMLALPGYTQAGAQMIGMAEQQATRRDAAAQHTATLAAEAQRRRDEFTTKIEEARAVRDQARVDALERDRRRFEDQMALRQFAIDNRPAPQPRADPLVQVEVADPAAPGGKRVIYAPQSQAAGMSPPGPGTTGKALPVSAAQKMFDNNQNLRRAETALALIEGKTVGGMQGDASATGLKGFAPDALLQRFDKSGIQTRAAIADLGSLVIHDRSGAAVTAAEFPRLKPFIPDAKDDPATVKKKLANFISVYRQTAQEMQDFYRESGYNVPQTQQLGTQPGASGGASGEWGIRRKD